MDLIWESVISINRIKFSCTVIELHRNEQNLAQTCLQLTSLVIKQTSKELNLLYVLALLLLQKEKKSEVTLGYNDAKADQRASESYSQIN